MTLGELKKHIAMLEEQCGLTDDIPVMITYECDNNLRRNLSVRFAYSKEMLIIEAKDVPCPEDLTIMAAAACVAYDDELSDSEWAVLNNFSMAAF